MKDIHRCDHCDRVYKNQATLRRHKQVVLNGKKFLCEHCGKRFALKQYLKDHMNLHTGDLPYKCTMCDAAFYQAGKLSFHVKKEHKGISGSVPIRRRAIRKPEKDSKPKEINPQTLEYKGNFYIKIELSSQETSGMESVKGSAKKNGN